MRMESGIVSDAKAVSEHFNGCSFPPYQHQVPEFFSHLSAIKKPTKVVLLQSKNTHFTGNYRVNNCSSLPQCQLFLLGYLYLKLRIEIEPPHHHYFWFWSSIFLGDSYCTSSLAILMLSVTSENTVGFINRPLSSMARPPHSSLAPSFFPLSISSRILSNCLWSICQTQNEKKQTAAPLLSWFQRGVMECGPGARLQGTVKLGQFIAHFRMWQSGSEQGEREDMGIALSHRK